MPDQNIVFSTDPDFKLVVEKNDPVSGQNQNIRIHLDRRRGGKIVTVIKGFQGTSDAIYLLAKNLKKLCSSGGTIKSEEILLQGNMRDKVLEYFNKNGFKAKLSGG